MKFWPRETLQFVALLAGCAAAKTISRVSIQKTSTLKGKITWGFFNRLHVKR